MKRQLLWTEQALIRLGEIDEYVGQRNPTAATHLVDRIIERATALIDQPGLGRTVPELPGSALREVIEGNYRVVYRVREHVIEVVTVFEGHRQFPVTDVGGEPERE